MIICIVICITFIICFAISAKIYYTLKINKDFRVKAKDIRIYCDKFIGNYLADYTYTDRSKMKYLGKPIDIYHLCKTISDILIDVK